MSKETPKIDKELADEFDKLIKEESRRIRPEEQLKKALWVLDMLKQEKKINSDTKLNELVEVIKERKTELQETNAYAKNVALSHTTDETGSELRKVAEEEAETAKRLLNYIDSALAVLVPMKESGYYPEKTVKDLQSELGNNLKVRETQVKYDEERQRNEEK